MENWEIVQLMNLKLRIMKDLNKRAKKNNNK